MRITGIEPSSNAKTVQRSKPVNQSLDVKVLFQSPFTIILNRYHNIYIHKNQGVFVKH